MNEKTYYTKEDIMARYDCGINKAKQILREIKHMNGGTLALGKGKALLRELKAWEEGIGL